MHMHLVQDDVMHKECIVSLIGNLAKLPVGLDIDFGVNVIAADQSGACTMMQNRPSDEHTDLQLHCA